jgi:hypothetical protein
MRVPVGRNGAVIARTGQKSQPIDLFRIS